MKRKRKPSNKKLQESKRTLKQFKQLISETRKHVREALKKGPTFEKELHERLDASEAALAIIRKKLTAAKAHSKKRKQEIDEWKLWYNGHAHVDKSDELKQLNEEISWRAADIAAKEVEVSALYIELVQAEGVSEQIKIQIQALGFMDFDGKVDDDVRIKTLLKEKKQVEAKIAKIK